MTLLHVFKSRSGRNKTPNENLKDETYHLSHEKYPEENKWQVRHCKGRKTRQ